MTTTSSPLFRQVGITLLLLCTIGWGLWPACQQKQVKQEATTEQHTEPAKQNEPTPRDTHTPDQRTPPEASSDAPTTDAPATDALATDAPTTDAPTTTDRTSTPPDQAKLTGIWSADAPIDIHAHIGSFSGYDLSTPTLLANLQKYGIRWALISNIDGANLSATRNISEDKANQATIDDVRRHPDRLRGIYWTRPNKGIYAQAEQLLQTTISTSNPVRVFVAMKFHPDMNQFPADSTKLDPYMKLCQKYKLAAVFHSGSTGSNADPQKIYALAKRYPTVPVVLYHMGFFGPHNDAIKAAQTALTQKDARLYLGTAQADPKAVLQAVKTLGSAYVMFGTDAAYFAPDHYNRYLALVQQLRAGLSPTDFAHVMRTNARTLFQLP